MHPLKFKLIGILPAVKYSQNVYVIFSFPVINSIVLRKDTFSHFILFIDQRKLFGMK